MYPKIKMIIDLLISSAAILLLSPIFLIIAILIKVDSSGPILFKQKRIGKNKKHFVMYKFRTMYVSAPPNTATHLLNNPGIVITRVGRFLRKTSLDELPQLFNVLKGEMAIVGPRPALWNQHDLIKERDKYSANDIRPGLTGWAQINGRDKLKNIEKAGMDGYYVEHISFLFDIRCFFSTFISVAKRDNIVEGKTEMKSPKRHIGNKSKGS